jgi:hypothetical protein
MRLRSAATIAGLCAALLGMLLPAPARAAVEVDARLDRVRATVGESVSLDVTVRGAASGVGTPEFRIPPGLELVGTSRSQSFSWVNGRSSTETVFHLEIGTLQPGRYALGPIQVRVGRQVFQSGVETLVVTAAPESVGGGVGIAALVAQVEPREPWVGEPVILRVRLVLAEDLAEEPNYVPPVTTGFWAETPSRPESYVASQAGRRVLVTETRARLVPLAPGIARIGSASVDLALARSGPADRLRWLSGRGGQRLLTVRSQPIEVRVRPLPPGAPAGFDGAVGTFVLRWSADRAATSEDVPVVVRLDVRGSGNLPLLKTPVLVCPEGEVFAGTAQDSLALPGALTPGHRRYQWNVLPRRTGLLRIPAPSLAWFDPEAGHYRSADLPPVVVDVGPPVFSPARGREAFPGVFVRDAPDPFARGLAPWAWALAGLLGGGAVMLWRARPPADPHAEQRARVATWRHALRAPSGTAFWRAAEEVAEWLERRGRAVADVRALVKATRYGGGEADADAVRVCLAKELSAAFPAPPARRPTRPAALLLAAGAAVLLALSGFRLGESAAALRLRAADQVARSGEVSRARSAWLAMWREGARAPALAARLAWAETARGALAPAAVWVLRGRQVGARDPALAWVADLVREGGGLAGERAARLPVRRTEWAVLALALGLAAGGVWPRRGLAVLLLVLALVAAVAEPAEDWWVSRAREAVVARSVTLEGTGLELGAGQVVRVLGREGERARVRAGRDLDGRVPARALLIVGSPR